MMADLLEIVDVSLRVPTPRGMDPILTEVSFSLGGGESLGLVGESGSGKSMTLKAIARLLPSGCDEGGDMRFGGVDLRSLAGKALRDFRTAGVGMIFQDPQAHLDPLQKIGDFMIEPAITHGTATRRQARSDAAVLLEAVGLDHPERRMRQYPLEMSGGMLQRVMIASVLLAQPRLILADEPTTALDVTTQSDVLAILDEMRREKGTAMIFVTHDLDLAAAVCDRLAVMYAGTIQEVRPAQAVCETPLHPYSEALLASRPDITATVELLPVVPGQSVSAAEAPPGCVFSPRCPHAMDICRSEQPGPAAVSDGVVRCHRLTDLHPEAAS